MVFVSCQFYLALFTVNSGSFSIFRSICLFLNLAIHFSENLGIFRVALLFICQRSVILRCCCSQRQLWYLIMTAFVCQQLFWFFQIFFPTEKPSFLRWIFILPYCFLLCQQLFTFIFQSIYTMVEMAQKKKSQSLKILLLLPIGSKRRKRDLNPRAGCPTYTLSRGASSASWVFLHNLKIVSTNMLLASFRDAKIIIHKVYVFVNCFFY